METDKRQFKRVELKDEVSLRFNDSENNFGSLSSDIGLGGVKINCHEFLALGTEVVLEIKLNKLEVIHCTGRVVWVQKVPHSNRYQAGLEFSDDSLLFDARSHIHSSFRNEFETS